MEKMKISSLWKQLITESILKITVRKPSQLNCIPDALRFTLEQICRVFSSNKQAQI